MKKKRSKRVGVCVCVFFFKGTFQGAGVFDKIEKTALSLLFASVFPSEEYRSACFAESNPNPIGTVPGTGCFFRGCFSDKSGLDLGSSARFSR